MKPNTFIANLLLLISCSTIASEQYIKGLLLDNETRDPIKGAIVSLIGGQAKHNTSTDSNGAFHIPLHDSTKGGGLVRISIEHPSYQYFDQYIGVSTEEVRVITLQKRDQDANLEIDNVIFLRSSSNDQLNYEIILRNNGSSPIFLSKMLFKGKIRIGSHGYTGFIHREKYALLLDSKTEAGFTGKAQPNTNLIDQSKAWYPIEGAIEYEKNTHMGMTTISANVGMPFNLRIDPKDKASVVITVARKDLKMLEESGADSTSTMGGIAVDSTLALVTDKGVEIDYQLPNPYLMLWLTLDDKFPHAGMVESFVQR